MNLKSVALSFFVHLILTAAALFPKEATKIPMYSSNFTAQSGPNNIVCYAQDLHIVRIGKFWITDMRNP